MHHSLAEQVDHYSTYIRHHSGWEYVWVYADEAKTGTKDGREKFQRMLADCRSGNIDHIITKSISRFSRNTVTLLETVRELKGLGIGVYFEEQSIDTATADGELLLSILASWCSARILAVFFVPSVPWIQKKTRLRLGAASQPSTGFYIENKNLSFVPYNDCRFSQPERFTFSPQQMADI